LYIDRRTKAASAASTTDERLPARNFLGGRAQRHSPQI
jgi:hypothetical protein